MQKHYKHIVQNRNKKKNGNVSAIDQGKPTEISGKVNRLTPPIVSNDATVIKFVLENGKLYAVNANVYEEASFIEKGDVVTFKATILEDEVQGFVDDFKIEGFEIK